MLSRLGLLAAATQAFTGPRLTLRAPRRPRTAIVKASAADVFEVATGAFDWTCNLGAPAALVAGAVMATSQEYKDDESLVTREADHKWVRQAKKVIKVLLVGSFACEVLCVFVSTVTGTMLLSSGEGTAHAVKTLVGRDTAMGFLQANHEFEYLTCRLSFLNGLLSWLGAVALKYAIPQPEEGESTRKMNRFAASLLTSTMVLICVEIKILRRVRAESSRRPPRHRRAACSMAWRCRFLTARPSQDGHVIASTRRTG